jgi:hypothetical protein
VDINDLDPTLYVTVNVTGVLNSQGVSDNVWRLHIYIAANVAGQCAPGGPADRVEIGSVLITNPDGLTSIPLDITVSALQSGLLPNPEGVSLSLQAINGQASDLIPMGWSAEVTFNVTTP